MTLTTEHHAILKTLRDDTLDTEARDALETLLRAMHDKTDAIEVARLRRRLETIERGLEHLATLMVFGPDAENTTIRDQPHPFDIGAVTHLQYLLDVVQGVACGPWIDTVARVLSERYERGDTTRLRNVLQDGGKTECHDPTCRMHRRWWFTT